MSFCRINKLCRPLRPLFFVLIVVGLMTRLGAQEPVVGGPAEIKNDLPVADQAPVRTARLTFIAGSVQIQRADNTGEDTPVLNMPLNEGTRLVCGDYGQAEVEFEDGSVVRVTPRSSLTLDGLGLEGSTARTEMTLLSGLAYFELRKANSYIYTLHAAGVTLTPIENATVRVHVEDGPAVFSVLSGAVRLERAEGFRAEVRAGESLHGDAKDESRYFLNSQIVEESWDRWNESRDLFASEETGKRTAARDNYAGGQGYGWSDLDANGTWYNVPGQGQVWQPTVADENFDPYGYGNWVWSNVGYVWASGYSWGWTPFRCGDWVFFPGFGWGWMANNFCGRWGFGGGGDVLIGRGPTHYKPVPVPIKGPGKVHPIVPVHGVDGPRPPVLPGGVRRIGGVPVSPLPPVGAGFGRGGSVVGQALNRDFPVDMKTHRPLLGAVVTEGNSPGAVLVNRGGGNTEWRSVQPKDKAPVAVQGEHGTWERRSPGVVTPPAPLRASPVQTVPVQTLAPVRTPSSAPAPAPVQSRPPAPMPAPPPVQWHSAPAPAPQPVQSPAKTDTGKSKG